MESRTFITYIEGESFQITLDRNNNVYTATTSNYDGSGDHVNFQWSTRSDEAALLALVESLEESILKNKL